MRASLAAIFVLSGCATAAGLQEKEPRIVYDSAQPVADIEECLALALSPIATPSVIHGANQTILVFGNPSAVISLTLRARAAGGTAVELRSVTGVAGRWRRAIMECL